KKIKINSEYLIKNGIISFIGSDAHGLDKRTPEIKKGIEAISKIDRAVSETILKNNSNILQAGYELIKPQKIKKKSKIFEIFH
ncbi:MAG TPA: exopolysaccharide biosynthesis protein, partial [Clostridiaceae bacterium]|nr:exopolysaccharide biosynthesis protein [Clostridiaceae bacterium]HBX47517.1 exopolysaccharide biosynthesis protein [Clostridiaceae bacterium]